jgi:hypothetical protein
MLLARANQELHVAYPGILYGLFTYFASLNDFICSTSDVSYSITYTMQLWRGERLCCLLHEKNIWGGWLNSLSSAYSK